MKTNKQKCLEMWEWLADNPGKGKEDYRLFLESLGRGYEYALCSACVEAIHNCRACPVGFPYHQLVKEERDCMALDSPYGKWLYEGSTKELSQKYALEMIELIKETWEE